MEKMNALTLIITLVVGVILTGALLGPVISDATKTEETFVNDGYFRMTEYDASTEVVFKWEYDNPNQITINDTAVTIPANSINREPRVSVLFGSDSLLVRSLGDSDGNFIGVQAYTTTSVAPKSCYVGMTTPADMTITCSEGTATVVSYGTNLTAEYTTIYAPSNDGAYIMKEANKNAYLLGDSDIHAFGLTNLTTSTGSDSTGLYFNGDVDEITIGEWKGNPAYTYEYTDVSINATEVSGYNNLYSLSNVTFNANVTETVEGSPVTTETPVTYSYFLVPYEVTAELTNHLTPGQISLMGAIPVMVIVALLMLAVGAIALRRAD